MVLESAEDSELLVPMLDPSLKPVRRKVRESLPTVTMTTNDVFSSCCCPHERHERKGGQDKGVQGKGVTPVGDAMVCCICQDGFEVDGKGVHLPCGHFLHPQCCEDWLQRDNFCPVCRAKISSGKDEEEETADEADAETMGGHWRCIACTSEVPDRERRCSTCHVTAAAARVGRELQHEFFPRVLAMAAFHTQLHHGDITAEQKASVQYSSMVEALEREVHTLLHNPKLVRLCDRGWELDRPIEDMVYGERDGTVLTENIDANSRAVALHLLKQFSSRRCRKVHSTLNLAAKLPSPSASLSSQRHSGVLLDDAQLGPSLKGKPERNQHDGVGAMQPVQPGAPVQPVPPSTTRVAERAPESKRRRT
jgi:hypothetical protein